MKKIVLAVCMLVMSVGMVSTAYSKCIKVNCDIRAGILSTAYLTGAASAEHGISKEGVNAVYKRVTHKTTSVPDWFENKVMGFIQAGIDDTYNLSWETQKQNSNIIYNHVKMNCENDGWDQTQEYCGDF